MSGSTLADRGHDAPVERVEVGRGPLRLRAPLREALLPRVLEPEGALGVRLVERVVGHEGRVAREPSGELAPEGLGLRLERRVAPEPPVVPVPVELLPARSRQRDRGEHHPDAGRVRVVEGAPERPEVRLVERGEAVRAAHQEVAAAGGPRVGQQPHELEAGRGRGLPVLRPDAAVLAVGSPPRLVPEPQGTLRPRGRRDEKEQETGDRGEHRAIVAPRPRNRRPRYDPRVNGQTPWTRHLGGPAALLALASLAASLLAAEGAVRLLSPIGPALLVTDPAVGKRYVPGFRGRVFVDEVGREVDVRFNSAGFRGPEWAPRGPAGGFRIAVLGDSMTAAIATDEERTFVRRLEASLASREASGPVEVMNFGVASASTGSALVTWRGVAAGYRPDLVLLAFFTGNDFGTTRRA